ncbi:capsid cement protein [Curtobacterium sp. MCBD17_028]|uniref:capsid cement protein n=1 Tax=Curtobacterium sp. MCBD17_028 TaxID=2175670 RepID=UPI000DA869C6|nr:capsid cement protein [Curtobacterium sp. MCBD17_028]PZE23862.1 DUF2190 domain-containing protein [Curtobacterium sp. MCBD17_028]
MADYAPRFVPGQNATYVATTPIVGGQLVEVTGNRSVGTAADGSVKVVGVALYDARVGDEVAVVRGGTQRLLAVGAIVAGDRVAPAANGAVSTDTTGTIGLAVAGAADGGIAEINLTLV